MLYDTLDNCMVGIFLFKIWNSINIRAKQFFQLWIENCYDKNVKIKTDPQIQYIWTFFLCCTEIIQLEIIISFTCIESLSEINVDQMTDQLAEKRLFFISK